MQILHYDDLFQSLFDGYFSTLPLVVDMLELELVRCIVGHMLAVVVVEERKQGQPEHKVLVGHMELVLQLGRTRPTSFVGISANMKRKQWSFLRI